MDLRGALKKRMGLGKKTNKVPYEKNKVKEKCLSSFSLDVLPVITPVLRFS